MIMKAIEIPQIINQRQSERGWKKLNFFCTSRRPQVSTKRGWLHSLWLYMHNIYIYIELFQTAFVTTIQPTNVACNLVQKICFVPWLLLLFQLVYTFSTLCVHIILSVRLRATWSCDNPRLENRVSDWVGMAIGIGWAMGVGVGVGGVPRLGGLKSRPKRKRKLWHFGSQVESV